MYQLLISILIALGIILSADQFHQMSAEQKTALENEHLTIEITDAP